MATNTTPPASNQAHLLRIPLECFEIIAELVNKHDLRALRLTCTESASKTARTFANIHFKERHILVTSERSLRNVIAIAKHPAFSRPLRKLVVVICPLYNPRSQAEYLLSSSKRAENVFKTAYKAQKALQMSEEDLSLLTELFGLIKNSIKLDIAGDIFAIYLSPARMSHLHDGFMDHLDPVTCYDSATKSNKAIRKIMRAMSKSQVSVQEIRMVKSGGDEWTGLQIPSLRPSGFDLFNHAWKNIKHLELFTNTRDGLASDEMDRFCSLLANDLQLETLSLRMTSPKNWDDGPSFHDFYLFNTLRFFEFPRLRRLTLEGVAFTISSMRSFVENQPLLSRLCLREIEVLLRDGEMLPGEVIQDTLKRYLDVEDLEV